MIKNQISQSLAASELANYLDVNELTTLADFGNINQFAELDVILQQGTEAQGIYVILEGRVKVTAKSLDDITTELATLGPGSFVGESSYIERIPSNSTFTAIEKTECALLTDMYMSIIADKYPLTYYKLNLALGSQICARLTKVHNLTTTYISDADMTAGSYLSGMMHSLLSPSEIKYEIEDISFDRFQKSTLFKEFTLEEIKMIFDHATAIKCKKHCTLIHKDEVKEVCYIVLQGAVQSSIVCRNVTAKLSVIGPMTLFASITCVDPKQAFSISFTTCEKAVLLKISADDLKYFQIKHPLLWYKLFQLIIRSLVVLERSVNKLNIRLNIEKYNR